MVIQTALLIIPPPNVQAFAAPLRKKYAPDYNMQGPAHITLFYPFVSPKEVPTSINLLRSLCSDVSPFKLRLDRYDHFETTQYLAPSDPEPILSLHRLLRTAFPDCLPYEGQHGNELIPHLTLTHDEDPKELEHIILPPVPSFTFLVDRLYLYIGPPEGNIPWIPVAIISLGVKM
jgi:2'-5' RNA ligase